MPNPVGVQLGDRVRALGRLRSSARRHRPAHDAGGFLSPAAVGRVSSALYLICGTLVMAATPLLPQPAGTSLLGVELVALTAVVLGVVVRLLPWHRWGPSAPMWLLPLAFAVVAAYNLATRADGYRYPLFFTVVFVWMGLAHPPGTSIRFLPLAAVAYVGPLVAIDAGDAALASACFALPVLALIGETAAWVGERARRSDRRFRSLVQHATDVITVIGPDGRIVYDSPAIETVLGYPPGARIGRPATEVLHPDDLPLVTDAMASLAERPDATVRLDLRARHADGSIRWCATVVQDLRDDPAVAGIVVNFRDVTAERETNERLRHQAEHDDLTGLANRSLCRRHVDALVRRGDAPVAVLVLDLDRFKIVNDSLGHAAGDVLIAAVAGRLRAAVPEGSLVARLGGDEFAVVLDGDAANDAAAAAAGVIAALRDPFTLSGHEVSVGASIGIAVHDGRRSSSNELLRDADAAMYVAKRTGGSTWRMFEPGMRAAALDLLETQSRLRHALEHRQFVLHYQPLVDLRSGAVVGAEALIRWQHPERGLLGPAEFVPIAEDTGLIVPMGHWAVGEACAQLARWQAEAGERFEVSVNLSGRQLGDPQLVPVVARSLEAAGVAPERLVLEITESQAVEDPDLAVRRLCELKQLGVRIAIDDFGTGQSSLAYLRTFPVDVLKLDRSFVADVGADARATQLVEAILGLGRALRLETVAEGIETEEQRRLLRALGCHLGQGYHLGRPAPADALRPAPAAVGD